MLSNHEVADPIDLTSSPILNSSVVYKQRDDAHLFFNTQIPDWIVVSGNSAYILSLCDGGHSINRILDELRQAGSTLDVSLVCEFLKFAHQRGIIRVSGLADVRIPVKAMPQLQSVYFKLTNRCTLECDYCYASSGPGKTEGEMTTAEWRSAVDQLRPLVMAQSTLTITGGEPMLRKDFEEIADYARSAGFRIGLITNGSLLSPENAPRLAQLFDSIQVSLDGDEAVHDKHRGRGSWRRARRAIDLLKQAGADYFVSATLSPDNKDLVKDLVQEFGSRLRMGGILAAGRAKVSKARSLTDREYAAATKASGAAGFFEDINFLEASRGHPRGHCGAGSSIMSIDQYGNVFPCQILISSEMAAGNMRNGTILEILRGNAWDDLRGATVDHDPNLGCATCKVRYICGGGCKAKIYYNTSTFKGPDGLCELWRDSIVNGLFKTAERPQSPSLFIPAAGESTSA